MIRNLTASVILCVIGVPLLVFWTGGLLVGPYEGEGGLVDLMGSIYGDLATLHLSAWILLFAPLLIVGIWYGAFRLRSSLTGRSAE